MNLFKFLLIVLITVGSYSSTSAQNKKSANLSFQSEEHDYEKIAQNSNGETIFEFTNTGEAPLVISKVTTSCGCTVPSYSKEAILPGDTGEILIKYETKKVGAFTKTITVLSNSIEPTKTLKIMGEVTKTSL